MELPPALKWRLLLLPLFDQEVLAGTKSPMLDCSLILTHKVLTVLSSVPSKYMLQPALCIDWNSSILLTFSPCFFSRAYDHLLHQPPAIAMWAIPLRSHFYSIFQTSDTSFRFLWDLQSLLIPSFPSSVTSPLSPVCSYSCLLHQVNGSTKRTLGSHCARSWVL